MTERESQRSRSLRWSTLRLEEERAFEKARDAAANDAGPARREALARDWFSAASRVLVEYYKSHADTSDGEPHFPVPLREIGRAAVLFEELAQGRVKDVIKDAIGQGGRPGMWRAERKGLAVAVRYIELSKSGEIADRAYNKTVAQAFSVDRTTVQRWWKKKAEIVCDFPQWYPEQVTAWLPTEGARYHYNRTGERTEGVD